MKLQDFDYDLPANRIAQQPLPERDDSRMMVLDRRNKTVEHRHFYDLPDFLQSGDALIINETKVLNVRLVGKKESGAKVEVLLVRPFQPRKDDLQTDGQEENRIPCLGEMTGEWECLVKSSGTLHPPTSVFFENDLVGELGPKAPNGLWRLRLQGKEKLRNILPRIGFPPLPPYIRRNGNPEMRARDLERYQTVYARNEGAIAAPTAGLHFTDELLGRIRQKGVAVFPLTLHVGVGTFLPVREEEIAQHWFEPEFFNVPRETAEAANSARASGKRVVAVGTTVTRSLESSVDEHGKIQAQRGQTGLFITPGYPFRAIDGLVTNFHLPRSTLLMLVAAFAGREYVLSAYQEAIRENYRFYSYGDAMLIY
jgi:S-adenosylmethionine:tRNA ribosyltransferase-isomerase